MKTTTTLLTVRLEDDDLAALSRVRAVWNQNANDAFRRMIRQIDIALRGKLDAPAAKLYEKAELGPAEYGRAFLRYQQRKAELKVPA
jgi:hypothetical protein